MEEAALAKGRRVFYTLLYALLRDGEEGLPDHFTKLLYSHGINPRDLRGLREARARDYRLDLDPIARAQLPLILTVYYNSAGFRVEDVEPDSLEALIAFMARLAEEEANAVESGAVEAASKYRRAQLRTLTTHLKPLLEGIAKATGNESVANLAKLIEEDARLLKDLLARPRFPARQ